MHRKSSIILSSSKYKNKAIVSQVVLKVSAGESPESTILKYITDHQLNPTPQESVVSLGTLWSSEMLKMKNDLRMVSCSIVVKVTAGREWSTILKYIENRR